MKKIRYANFRNTYSPFSNSILNPKMEALGFKETSLIKADLVVCRNLKHARMASCFFPFKKIIVWTHEPRYDASSRKVEKGMLGQNIYIFNVFMGNVFFHNSHFFGSYHYDHTVDLGITPERIERIEDRIDRSKFDSRKCLFGAFTKKDPSHFHYNIEGIGNVDGNFIRQSLIEDAITLGIGEVAGKGWEGLEIENSGYGGSGQSPWWIQKIKLMEAYNFSIAIENTIYPFYVTEKIWQSIKALSLPIYVGKGSSIYDAFPPESFIDFSDFSSNEDLLRYINSLTYEEWCKRMDLCIATYNAQVERLLSSRQDRLAEVVQRVRKEVFDEDVVERLDLLI